MTFVDSNQQDMRGILGSAPPDTPRPNLDETLAAAFRQTNSLISILYDQRNSGAFEPVPGYNPYDEIKDTPYFESHPYQFAASRSPAETKAIMARLNREATDKRTLANSGHLGSVAGLLAGAVDPVWYLPFTGGPFARIGKAFATQEAILSATQTRPLMESVEAVGSGTLLWGTIGAGAARLLAREGSLPAVEAAFNRDRSAMAAHAAGEVAPPTTSVAGSIGAAATDTRTLERVPTGIGVEKLPIGPQGFLLNQPSVNARRALADLSEIPTEVMENVRGETTTLGGGPPVETRARIEVDKTRIAIGDELERQWVDMKYGGQKAPWFARFRAQFGIGDRSPDLPTFEQFKDLVSEAIMNDGKHSIPQVQQAAQFVRKNLFDIWGPRAEAAIEEFKQLTPVDGEGYFPHLWDKTLIAARRPEFTNRLTELYHADQTAKAAIRQELISLRTQLDAAQKRVEWANTNKHATDADRAVAATTHDTIHAKIEDKIAAWEGKTTAEAKAAIKAREKYRIEESAKGKLPGAKGRLTSADAAVESAVKDIIERDRDLPIEELRDIAHETVRRILGSPDGRLTYEAAGKPEIGYSGGGGDRLHGSLEGRELNVTNAWAKDWIQTDIEHVVNSYMRSVIPDTLIAERFGDVRMTESFRKIEDDYASLTDATKPEAERNKLEKQRERALNDLAGVRDRIRGVYGLDTYNAMQGLARTAQAVKSYNIFTSLGVAALSSLPDMAGSVFRWGLGAAFNDAWAPFTRALMSGDLELPREAFRQFRAMSVANEMASAQRHRSLNDIMDAYQPKSRLESTLQWGADKFQFINALAQWTDLAKTISATITSQEIFRAAKALSDGTATAKQTRALAANNIDANLAGRIAREYEASGATIDGVKLPNTDRWTDRSAIEAFEGAVAREANIAVVTPGQEKALWLSNPILNVFGQFKSFTAASTERILIAGLQRHDAHVLQGVLISLGLGMISYKINSILGGQPTSDRPQDWIKEGISRGSLLGWFEEGNALASKSTGGRLDVYRLIGADKPLSRYAGRSALDQLLGPTAGKIEAMQKVGRAAASLDWNASDTSALRKLIAFQNVFYLRNLFNAVESGANNAFGIPPAKQ